MPEHHRPLTYYAFEFVNGAETFVVEECGRSPCRARARAFIALEAYLKQNPSLPSQNWRLVNQTWLRAIQGEG